jgi:AcrR family transcriptional regulator
MAQEGRRPVSTELIIATALAIADVEGLEAVSMRRLGRDLGYAGMSLYSYVHSKEALLDQMADHAVGSLPTPARGHDWRPEIAAFYSAFHELYLRHPSVAEIMSLRPLVGPNTVDRGERVLSVLIDAGFDDDVAVEASIAFSSYTLGASLYEISRTRQQGATATDQFWGLEISREQHPTMHRLRARLVNSADNQQFTVGLERLLSTYAANHSYMRVR